MALTIGIVGLPNVGKSTLFNALTKNDVLAANYPFATIEPNVGVVNLPDPRLKVLADIFGSERILPATVSFVDIAGIVKGASEGEGLGNQFLANIREADAIAQVVRGFEDSDVVHVAGVVDAKDDLEVITAELALADLQTLEKAIARYEKEVRGKKLDPAVLDAALAAQKALEAGTPLSRSTGIDLSLLKELGLLTAKPIIYVFNVDESILTSPEKKKALADLVAPAQAVFLDAKVESELDRPRPRGRRRAARLDGADRVGPRPARPHRLRHPRAPDLPHGRPRRRPAPGRSARAGRPRTAAGVDPHRLREGLHQGGGHLVRRPRRVRLRRGGPGEGQGPHGGQGLRHAGRRRRGVPLQRLSDGTGIRDTDRMRLLDHIGISVADLDSAVVQFDPVLSALGYSRHGDEHCAFWVQKGEPDILLYPAREPESGPHVHGRVGWQHLAFGVTSAEEVDRLHDIAVVAEWTVVRAPKPYPRFGDRYYACYVEDANGIRLEFAFNPPAHSAT